MSPFENNPTRSILIAMAVVWIAASSVLAQASEPQSIKLDEFIGEADDEDIKARLDNFEIELRKYPNAQAHIIVYRTRRDSSAVSRPYLAKAKDYLIRRGLDRKRVVTVDGGMTGCLMYELWIVPPGAQPPARRYTYQYTLKESRRSGG